MKIAIGCDHAAYEAKARLADMLAESGHDVLDLGTSSADSVDYPDFAGAVAKAVSSGEADRGILICGTGIGMSITANKVSGVRAALVHDTSTTEMSRAHNDANVLCMGARILDTDTMLELTRVWLATDFEGGRHQRRVDKIMEYDSRAGGSC